MPTISHALTVDGRARSPNEDAYLADDALRLYAVADGVSTGAAGEIAAQRAIQVLHEAFQEAVEARALAGARADARGTAELAHARGIAELAHAELLRAAETAAAVVRAEAERDGPMRGMATSLTAAHIDARRLLLVSVGDTRALLIRDGSARTLTRVDTLADEFVRGGLISPESAAAHPYARVLTRAIGIEPETRFDALAVPLEPRDIVVLLTNGVDVSAAALAETVKLSPQASADALARQLLAWTGDDDATVVVVQRTSSKTELVFHAPPPRSFSDAAPVQRLG